MARTIETEPLQKHTLYLYEGDFDRLSAVYAESGGASVLIRRLVRAHLTRLESGVSPLTQIRTETKL